MEITYVIDNCTMQVHTTLCSIIKPYRRREQGFLFSISLKIRFCFWYVLLRKWHAAPSHFVPHRGIIHRPSVSCKSQHLIGQEDYTFKTGQTLF